MRNYLADYNEFVISANNKETALNTEQTLDTLLRIAKANIIEAEPRSESNADELTGHEEPDRLYRLGWMLGKTIEFPKAQPQHFGIGYGFGLGICTPTPWGTGYKHLCLPTSDMLLPGFTAAMKLGTEIEKRRHASIFIDTLTATWAKDSWAKLSLALKGTGKFTSNIYEETKSAAFNAVALTLLANGVQGATPEARLDSLHLLRALKPNTGEWIDKVVTVISGATPAVFTITAPAVLATGTDISFEETGSHILSVSTDFTTLGLVATNSIVIAGSIANNNTFTIVSVAAHDIVVTEAIVDGVAGPPVTIALATLCNHKILYVPTEPGWCTFPDYVEEPPLRVTDVVMRIGGKWNGTTFLGGHLVESEVNSIEHVLNNQMLVEFRIGGTGDYANYALRQGRIQTLKLDRQLRDWILNNWMEKNESIGVYMKATGDEFETGKNYYVETVFPKCGILKADLKVDGKILGQTGDLQVLEDATYGSVRAEIANQVAAYAA
jgi:hypothetical protein